MNFNISDINGKVTLNNGVQMPYFGLGVYKSEDGEEVKSAIHNAFDLGYRLVDTAAFYHNEEGVGEAINTSGVDRNEIFLTTKVWNDDHGYHETLKAFENSLEKLHQDYIDLYLIHWPVPEKFLETWKAMEEIYKSGKAKAIGVCNCMPHHIEEIIASGSVVPAVLQNEFHPRLVQQNILDFCKDKSIQFQAWSPLMRGRLLDNPILQDIADKYQKTIAQVILRWDLQLGVATIPKSVHKERIASNADVFNFALSEKDMQSITALDQDERTGAHPDNFMDHFKGRK